jgi:CHAT domain-containing protein
MMLGDFGRRIADKKLLVIKHDAFESVPMAALVNPATGKYLIETNEVLKLPSASILSVLKTPAASTAKTLAVFADPVYSPDDSRIAPAARRTPSDRERFLRRLFASRIEAQRISDLVPGGDAVVNMDFSASRENFFGVNLSNFRLIHFAAHALIDPTNPDASSIMLSEFDGSATSMSGAVRYNDIQRLDLNAELVVLSACQSGIGRQVRGEGFASLAQGFFSVGAKKVMFSRWEVDDKVTAETMVRFYRKLISEKLPPSTAARQAQVSLLSDPRWRHPYYWAAFTIQGSY